LCSHGKKPSILGPKRKTGVLKRGKDGKNVNLLGKEKGVCSYTTKRGETDLVF